MSGCHVQPMVKPAGVGAVWVGQVEGVVCVTAAAVTRAPGEPGSALAKTERRGRSRASVLPVTGFLVFPSCLGLVGSGGQLCDCRTGPCGRSRSG